MIVYKASAIATQLKLTLGTLDDGPALGKVMQWLASLGVTQKQPVQLDLEGLTYYCESTPLAKNGGDFTFGTASGFTLWTNTDTGPDTSTSGQRNRCHLQFRGFDRVAFGCGKNRIHGPHDDTERNKSLDSMWEQQCGVWFQSVTEVDMTAKVDIDHVWGDWVDFGFASDDTRRTQRANIIVGRWERNGRVGVNMPGTASNVLITGDGSDSSYIKRPAGDTWHVELGGAGDFRNITVQNLMIYGDFRGRVKGTHGDTGGLTIANNISTSGLYVQVVPATGYRFQDALNITGNHWNYTADICDIWRADHVTITGNVGQVDAKKPLVRTDGTTAVMQFGNCGSVVTSPNTLTRV